MLFKTEVFETVGLFDPQYIWWYAPADYAVRTYKAGYNLKDFKRPMDQHNHIVGVIKHLAGRTYEKVKDDPKLPVDQMFIPGFRFSTLLKQHGLYQYYLLAEIQRVFSATGRRIRSELGINK